MKWHNGLPVVDSSIDLITSVFYGLAYPLFMTDGVKVGVYGALHVLSSHIWYWTLISCYAFQILSCVFLSTDKCAFTRPRTGNTISPGGTCMQSILFFQAPPMASTCIKEARERYGSGTASLASRDQQVHSPLSLHNGWSTLSNECAHYWSVAQR